MERRSTESNSEREKGTKLTYAAASGESGGSGLETLGRMQGPRFTVFLSQSGRKRVSGEATGRADEPNN